MRVALTVSVFFAWYDLWIGAYWDRKEKVLYICPVPTLVIRLARDDIEVVKNT